MNRTLAIAGAVIVVTAIVLASSVFIVHQTQQALVLQFGDPKREVIDPGLKCFHSGRGLLQPYSRP